MKLRHLFTIAAVAICLSNSADAAAVMYTLTGTGPSTSLSGSLNGAAFTATSFTFSAVGNTTNIVSGNWGLGNPTKANAVTASVSLNTNIGILTANLTSPSSDLVVGTVDYGGGYSVHTLTYSDGFTGGYWNLRIEPTSGLSDLATYGTYLGQFWPAGAANFTTDAGPLVLEISDFSYSGFFTVGPVAAVPEPATATSSLLLSLGGLSLISRRKRKA